MGARKEASLVAERLARPAYDGNLASTGGELVVDGDHAERSEDVNNGTPM